MKVATLHRGCTVCGLSPQTRTAINKAIWPDGSTRARNYRADGVAALTRHLGKSPDRKTVTRHADHVERGWRTVDGRTRSADDDERPVFATDFGSVIDKAASLGMRAMDSLDSMVESGMVEPKDLTSIAKLGVNAVSAREASRLKGHDQGLATLALFALVSGHLEVPEGEVIDVTPVDDLTAVLMQERRALHLAAGREVD